MRKKPNDSIEIHASSGNVFEDLGLKNPKERLAKAKLAAQIQDIIETRNLTQQQAADTIGIDQPKVSKILRGDLSGFTIERLLRFINALEYDVEIKIKPKPKSRKEAALRVSAC